MEAKIRSTDKYLFGVYDGHSGCACAQALKDRLFQYIAISMADKHKLKKLYQEGMTAADQLIEYLPTSTKDDVSPDLAGLHWQSALQFIQDSMDMYSLDNRVSFSFVLNY